MKKILCFLFLLFSFTFSVFSFSRAYDATDTGWKITNYDVEAVIDMNQKVNVTEEITADFNELQKHGIYRYIPYKYSRNGNSYNVRIKIDSVTDAQGDKIKYSESKSGGNLTLKIGDPNNTVTGEQKYKISYELERVINHFSDHDEFYWNVTGNDWPVPIENTAIKVIWPDATEVTQNVCYVGAYGSTSQDCKLDPRDNEITFTADKSLNPGEGFTIASAVKPGAIKEYSSWMKAWWFFYDNWGYLIPVFVLAWLLMKYFRAGRDPEGKKTIVPEFAPPDNLSPAMLGTVYDEKVDMKDISAVIIDLAVKGYLKIKELKSKGLFGVESTDYEFTDTGKDQKNLANFEKEIFYGIFGSAKTKKLSDLKNEFYTHIRPIHEFLYENVKKQGYFEENPKHVRNVYLGIGGAVMFLGFFIVPFLAIFSSAMASFMFAFVASGIMIMIFGFFMPKRTAQGVETTRKIKGFRLYMYTAERYRERFNEKEKIFEKYLPYAMVFGIVKEWAKKFEGLKIERPDWYEGRGAFYPVIFATNISSMQNSVNATMISSPSSAGSGGSGFSGGGSGGGFGGGGGGSW